MDKAELLNKVKNVYSERQLVASLRRDKMLASFIDNNPQEAKKLQAQAEARWEDLSNILDLAANNALNINNKLYSSRSGTVSLNEENETNAPTSKSDSSFSSSDFSDVYKKIYSSTYFCDFCNDTAFYYDGKCPKCYTATWLNVLRDNIDQLLPSSEHNFDNFDLDIFSEDSVKTSVGNLSPREQIKGVLNISREFLEDFPKASSNLFFTGKTGTGKTFFAECIANEVLKKNYLAVILSMLKIEEIINNLRIKQKSFSTKAEQLSKAQNDYNLLLEADLLVIDDLGLQADLLTNSLAELLAILHERETNKKNTIITSNLDMKDLKRAFDERLFSRLMQKFRVVPFIGEDLRLPRR